MNNTVKNILKTVKDNEITIIRFEYLSSDGKLRGMVTHADFLEEAITKGIGLAKGAWSLGGFDQLIDDYTYAAETSEFSIVPDLNTFAIHPYLEKSARFFANLYYKNGKQAEIDARYFLTKILNQFNKKGYTVKSSCEAEFFLLNDEDGKISPATGGPHAEYYVESRGYDVFNSYIQDVISALNKMCVKVERIKKEYSPSQIEIILRYTDAMKAADDLVTLRSVAKNIAQSYDLLATFLPKPFNDAGNSGLHSHISVYDKNSKNIFYDKSDKYGISKNGYYFMGGLLKHMKSMTAIHAPIPNSYKRMVPSLAWAPATVTWGYDNRGVAVRIPSISKDGGNSSTRVEFRVADPTANPYLSLGIALAAGLDGINNKIDPGKITIPDPNNFTPKELKELGIETLPETLGDAIKEMEKSIFLKKTLGEVLFREYLLHKKSEWQAYCRHVSEWEVHKYVGSF